METRQISWTTNGHRVDIGISEAGDGPLVLCLPALSSISTRTEMLPLIERLRDRFRLVTVDWPGFGALPKPRVDWTPDQLSAFLDWVLKEIAPNPHAIIASGHGAAYALHHFAIEKSHQPKLVLVAPTWRGPFPTMMGGTRPWFGRVRAAVDAPVIGSALYALNLSGPVLNKMVRGHVYSDADFLSGPRKAQKEAVTKASGARHASVRFVTGGLDRLSSRDEFLRLVEQAPKPLLLVYSEQTPPKSRAEMDAASGIAGVETLRLTRGKLSIHEEFVERIAPDIATFIQTP
jgi:pimeloyl-ACP methyl ester carboxylesterase